MNVGYALIMVLAIASGVFLSRLTQNRLRLKPWERVGIGISAFVGAMFGAKLPFLFEGWDTFLSGASWMSDGKTILTGLVGGYLGVEVGKWTLGVTRRTGDSFVVPVAVSIGIGRLACFYGGCCYGQPTDLPWGVVFPGVDEQSRHPTQIYESLFHLLMAGLFLWLAVHERFRGNRFKLYLILYASYRFFSEWWRPETEIFLGFTWYQLGSLVIIGLVVFLWFVDEHRYRDLPEGAEKKPGVMPG
ncbi:MAG: prolipoprotein diacylglyceryl transferase [Mariniblastus sp.]|nr:prolipoprotein diacylglyceryl transferase [Mariniblastus sp.]